MAAGADSVGQTLRRAREARDLSLEKAEQQTKIRAKFLDALEQDNFAALPTPVQAQGFLRNYARYLGLDVDTLSAQYDEAVSGKRSKRSPKVIKPEPVTPVDRANRAEQEPTLPSADQRTVPVRPTATQVQVSTPRYERPPKAAPLPAETRGFPVRRLLIGLVALVVLAGLLIAGTALVQGYLTSQGQSLAFLGNAPKAQTATVVPTVTPLLSPTPDLPTHIPVPADAQIITSASSQTSGGATGSNNGVALKLDVAERTWIEVIVDGVSIYIGAPGPSTTLQYQGKSSIRIHVENAIGIHAIFNGKDQGLLGARGQIVDLTYTPNGVTNSAPLPGKSPATPASVPS